MKESHFLGFPILKIHISKCFFFWKCWTISSIKSRIITIYYIVVQAWITSKLLLSGNLFHQHKRFPRRSIHLHMRGTCKRLSEVRMSEATAQAMWSNFGSKVQLVWPISLWQDTWYAFSSVCLVLPLESYFVFVSPYIAT